GLECLARDFRVSRILHLVDGFGERLFLDSFEQVAVGRLVVAYAVLLLFDAQDVDGALSAGEQIGPVFRLEEFAQRFDALDDHQEVVAAERAHSIDQIMPRSLILERQLGRIGEEVEKIEAVLPDLSTAPRDTLVSDRGALSRKIRKRVVNSRRPRVEDTDTTNLEV